MMTQLREALQNRWQALSVREQRGLRWLGGVVVFALAWQVLVAPAQHKLREADAQRQRVAQQHAHMLALQAEAQALQQRTALSREAALKALQSLSAVAGLQLNPQGERVLVSLKAVPATALSNWLAQARTQAQSLPGEVHLTRSTPTANALATPANATEPSTTLWDGTLVLVLPHGKGAGTP